MQEVGLNKISSVQIQWDYIIVEAAEDCIQCPGDAYRSRVPNHLGDSIVYDSSIKIYRNSYVDP